MARNNSAPEHTPLCPPLPPGSFDLDDLQKAASKGGDLAALIAPPAEIAQAPESPPEADTSAAD